MVRKTVVPQNLDLSVQIKLRHFRLVEMLVATRSIRQAANRLNITPAAVSKACIELENILGFKIFTRKGGNLVPHPICEQLIMTGGKINNELQNLMNEVFLVKDCIKDNIKIGIETSIFHDDMAKNIAQIKEKYPNLHLTLNSTEQPPLLCGLESNVYDFIFTNITDLKRFPRFSIKKLYEENYAIVNKENIYSIPEILEKWTIFSEKIWILPEMGNTLRDKFESALAIRGLSFPNRRIEVNSVAATEKMVSHFSGLALFSFEQLKQINSDRYPKVEILPDMKVEIGVVWLRDKKFTNYEIEVKNYLETNLSKIDKFK